jgi:hypothetical protein
MAFSLAAVLDYYDSQPEQVVMAMVAQSYAGEGSRGIFSEKFIPYADLHMLGYKGFRGMLVALYETDPSFVDDHRSELYALTKQLKGE